MLRGLFAIRKLQSNFCLKDLKETRSRIIRYGYHLYEMDTTMLNVEYKKTCA